MSRCEYEPMFLTFYAQVSKTITVHQITPSVIFQTLYETMVFKGDYHTPAILSNIARATTK